MKYKIKKQEDEYTVGTYLIDDREELHLIFYGRDYGFALLNLDNFETSTDFYESVSEMEHYTTIKAMRIVKQVNEVEFE
jgi:hypothetical protein